MAKKKVSRKTLSDNYKRPEPQVDGEMITFELDCEEAYVAALLTRLIQIISPTLDAALAYPVVYEMLDIGMTEDGIEYYGEQIRAITLSPHDPSKGVH